MEKSRSERAKIRDRNILISLVIILAIVWIVRDGSALQIEGAKIERDLPEGQILSYTILVSDPELSKPMEIEITTIGDNIEVPKEYYIINPGAVVEVYTVITSPASGYIRIKEMDPTSTGSVRFAVQVQVPVCVGAPCPGKVITPTIQPTIAPPPETTINQEVWSEPTKIEVEPSQSHIEPQKPHDDTVLWVVCGITLILAVLALVVCYRIKIERRSIR